jgi:hypothetical protein
MIPNILPSKVYPFLGSVTPQSLTSAAANTGGTYLQIPPGSKWLIVRLLVGAGAGSVAVTVNQALTIGGGSTKALTLTDASAKATTGILTAQPVTDFEFNLDTGMDVNGGFNFVQLVLTVTGTLIVAAEVSTGPSPYAN